MSKLTSAITSHDFEAISRIVKEEPSLIHEEVNGWLPIEWARRCGNHFTYARVIRLFGEDSDSAQFLQVLIKCITLISSNYFGGGTPQKAAKRAWEQIYEGKEHPFSKDEPDFKLNIEQRMDLANLIEKCGFTSKESFVAVFEE